ncbi:hypothetical protein [Micrococcus sp. TA1]|uniref:hypothetical protein n=1 Tax=Micrococcus sp. TA1 TaxID=681627 RepID=UPI00161F82A5|nr:hypothetical protein [Micrococcus sp. TA1]MBB5750107.1 hypothetical protein [Micrococcus sp. TA1]
MVRSSVIEVGQEATAGSVEIDAIDGGLPRERVEVMTQASGPTQLWWETKIDGRFSGWTLLEGPEQIVNLVKALQSPGDTLHLEDDQPVTRYAQTMLIEKGIYHLELAALQLDGTYNWRIGMGKEADAAVNTPDTGTAPVQEMTTAAIIEVLSSWAIGQGLPMGYGAALHIYGR